MEPENITIEPPNILIVDDKEENLLALEEWLRDFDLNIVKATSGHQALERLLEMEFALVLLDVQMPEMDGFEIADLMKGSERTKKIPIIFVTAISKSEKNIFRGYEAGAVDYIFKPLDPYMLRSKVSVFVRLHQQQQELQRTISELRAANAKIQKLSVLDSLTGCYNRGYLNDRLPKEAKRAIRYEKPLSAMIMDIDHFKKVNDTYGHLGGDEVLRSLAKHLQDRIRENIDWICRYGGEEFVLVLPETDIKGASTVAEKLCNSIMKMSIPYNNQTIKISSSFGVAEFDFADSDPAKATESLLLLADQRLYEAKKLGRKCVVTEMS